jgi:hypothetical protein
VYSRYAPKERKAQASAPLALKSRQNRKKPPYKASLAKQTVAAEMIQSTWKAYSTQQKYFTVQNLHAVQAILRRRPAEDLFDRLRQQVEMEDDSLLDNSD